MSATEQKHTQHSDVAPIADRLMGRIDYLLKIKRVKDPELMVSTLEVLTDLADAAKALMEIAQEIDDRTNPGLGLNCMRIDAALTRIYGEQA